MYSNILGTPIPLAVFNTLTCCAVPDLVYVAGLPRQWHWLPGYFQQHSYDDQGQVHGHQPACTLLHHGVIRAASGLADTLAAGLLVGNDTVCDIHMGISSTFWWIILSNCSVV